MEGKCSRSWNKNLTQWITYLIADIRQDINKVSSFSRCFDRTFPWWSCSIGILTPMRKVKNKNIIFWVNILTPLSHPFLHENVTFRHLLNSKPPFMTWRRSAIIEVNNWAPNLAPVVLIKCIRKNCIVFYKCTWVKHSRNLTTFVFEAASIWC